MSGVTSIIFIHNYLNDIPILSKKDIQITKEIKEVSDSDLIEIYFCDYIIADKEGFYSFTERCLIEL